MRTSAVLAIFCLAVGIAPSFSLPVKHGDFVSNPNVEGLAPSSSVPNEDSPIKSRHLEVRAEHENLNLTNAKLAASMLDMVKTQDESDRRAANLAKMNEGLMKDAEQTLALHDMKIKDLTEQHERKIDELKHQHQKHIDELNRRHAAVSKGG
ncbi:hypothetical protein F5148DRAFT_26678 [Russula earlei]|uniref:Uncharacterized protein n=1 Tax=Russula earlei TaxID=71964 RepID=A0ACC0TRC4_9AGAM|nr:hypothetical protein F5148DRAFT_26678 [Russula earlei]